MPRTHHPRPVPHDTPAVVNTPHRSTLLRTQLRPSATTAVDSQTALINQVLDHSLAKSTLDGYASAVDRFFVYCDRNSIPAQDRFPTRELVLSAYAASFAGITAGKTASSAIAALKAWHTLHNFPWQGGPRLAYVLRAVSNQAPASSHKPPRVALDRAAINTLHNSLDLTNPFDASVYAAATLAFWGQCRLGELLGTSRIRHNPDKFPSRSALPKLLSIGVSFELRLPCTKTSQSLGESVYITNQQGQADPLYALRNHLHVNKSLPPSAHLFAFRSPAGDIRCLAKEGFLKRCNELWLKVGLERITGHSFRIGGTNEYLRQGVPPDVVKATGRWRSDAFLLYWRSTNAAQAGSPSRNPITPHGR